MPKQAAITHEPEAAQPVPSNEGESVQQALLKNQYESRRPDKRVPVGNTTRVSVPAAVTGAYVGFNATQMLGAPESILLDPKPVTGANRWKYIWKKRNDRQTAAWIRTGIIRPVEADEVDPTNPLAEYVSDVKGDSTYVSWEGLGLFEMPPKWVKRIYDGPTDMAISRVALQEQAENEKFDRATGGAYGFNMSAEKAK
jgi:hypothetical protein